VNKFNVTYQLFASTPKYHVADKHDTTPSHFILTMGKPALL